tara:strand:- start:32343 stop:32735 length:393 start_codon:yes stop_codon:yes gene_type:complete
MGNKSIKRTITRLVFQNGPLTKNDIVGLLQKEQGVVVRTEGSISSLLAKNTQVIRVGTTREPNKYGKKIATPVYDVDRTIITCEEDLVYTTPVALMTPSESRKAKQCSVCGKVRVIPDDGLICHACCMSQ